MRPGVNQEQQKAMDFFNRYNDEQQLATQKHEQFIDNTKQLFTDDFKGFDFKVGEKKFRYGVKDPNAVAENQSNLNNFVGKFLDNEGNEVEDIKQLSNFDFSHRLNNLNLVYNKINSNVTQKLLL